METGLTQQEIDAMVKAARAGVPAEAPPAPPVRVEAWDLQRSSQIGHEQLEAITSLHEGFARNLTHALGAYLRVVFSTALVSAEHLTYREFLDSLPDTTYMAGCRLNPVGATAMLQLDLKIAFSMIDLLLGGEGQSTELSREITDIEQEILESVARILCRELGTTWQALSLEVVFDERMHAASARRLMPPEEKVLLLSFEITMAEVRGGLNIAVPATISHALLRKLGASWSQTGTSARNQARERLMTLLLDCPLQAELVARDLRLPVSTVAEISTGQVLAFYRDAAEPASLMVAGLEMFRAAPARCGDARAARVLEKIPDGRSSRTEQGATYATS